ncbi:MAG: hypothetical protein OXH76_09275 [Boseongicola sp.]|nr:hypothetical protein [Boseongicola sp.]
MSAENLTIQEVSEARVEAILADLKKAGSSGREPLAVSSEFELADVFADRFRDAFMVKNSAAYRDDPKWFYRPAPGIDKPPLAHFAVRHACKRMIFVLASADPENVQDRVWLERRKTVENVLEVASWDPRLSYCEGYVEGAP